MPSRRPLSLRIAALLLVVAASSARGQPRPDFSGTWTIDSARTQWGMSPPVLRTDRIEQTSTQLKVTRELAGPAGATSVLLTYGFDGADYKNTFGPIQLTSRLQWEGPVLVITSDQETPQGALKSVDRYSLSEEGRVLTVRRAISFGDTEDAVTLVFVKR